MNDRWWLQFEPDSKCRVLGLDQPVAEVWEGTSRRVLLGASNGELGDIVVLKVPGHHYWSGRGEQGYAGAEFQVYQVIGSAPSERQTNVLHVERLTEIPLTRGKR